MITAPAKSYMKLIKAFPLRPIRNDRHLDQATSVMTKLVVRPEETLDDGERDYLAVLTNLIEAYELVHYPMPTRKSSPAERLKNIVDEAHLKPSELETILGLSQASISLILSGKRGLSKTSITRLVDHFKIRADYFL